MLSNFFINPEFEIYSKLFKSWSGTIHTSMYEPQSLTAHITLGENKAPVEIDFQQWLNGESLNINELTGQIDTELTFATY